MQDPQDYQYIYKYAGSTRLPIHIQICRIHKTTNTYTNMQDPQDYQYIIQMCMIHKTTSPYGLYKSANSTRLLVQNCIITLQKSTMPSVYKDYINLKIRKPVCT